ncbi:MAG: cobalt ECF transporter T component CbiQ [Micrococcales bacterium]|nr:MAG: cobalt ECF transporter T component CbiQ [Micrococcales bacterium]
MPHSAPSRLAIDDAAWTNRWSRRAGVEKAVLALGLLGVSLSVSTATGALLIMTVTGLFACLGARVPLRTWLVACSAPWVFIAIGLLGIVVTLDSGPTAIARFGPLAVTEHSLQQGISTGSRSTAAASALMLLATTTPIPRILNGIGRVPGLSVLADIAAAVYRLIFELLDAQARIRASQTARLGYTTPATARASLGLLASAVMRRAWTRARRLDVGLRGRGVDGQGFDCRQAPTRTQPVDTRFVVGSVAVVTCCAVAIHQLSWLS